MLIKKLHKLGRDIELLSSGGAGESWNHAALLDINERIHQLLSEATEHLEQLNEQLKSRKELQELLMQLKHKQAKTRTMLWQEQVSFYQDMITEIQEHFKKEENAYITISLTTLEILFLIRLFLEEEIIQADSLQPIFRFLSSYTGTLQHSRLSFESLKKRYSSSTAVNKKVKQLLQRMITRIDKYYNDK
ncbi:hypothetical protein SAMN05216436_11326 [bacterium A37T11]|nr:hypothetical protein SAMN05216436_11326 [bacterium A37T11]